MGFEEKALDEFAGRYVKIVFKSPKRIKGPSGTVYRNK